MKLSNIVKSVVATINILILAFCPSLTFSETPVEMESGQRRSLDEVKEALQQLGVDSKAVSWRELGNSVTYGLIECIERESAKLGALGLVERAREVTKLCDKYHELMELSILEGEVVDQDTSLFRIKMTASFILHWQKKEPVNPDIN